MKEQVKQKEYDLRSAHAKERRRPTLASASSRAGAQANADAEALARGHSQVETQRGASRSGGRTGRSLLLHAVTGSGTKGQDPAAAAATTATHELVIGGAPAEPHAGLLLRRAREERGLTVSDIAKKTRIADRWIVAIEEVRIDQLPAPVFAIGYVRNYARAVGLDPGEIVELFRQFGRHHDDSFWGSLHDRSGPTQRSLEQAAAQRKYLLWTAAFLLLGLGALLTMWLRSRH